MRADDGTWLGSPLSFDPPDQPDPDDDEPHGAAWLFGDAHVSYPLLPDGGYPDESVDEGRFRFSPAYWLEPDVDPGR